MTNPLDTFTPPQVNLNGDRRETLVNQVKIAYQAALDAGEAIRCAHPHGRNYQLKEGTYELAEKEWRAHMDAVSRICQYYQKMYLEIAE